MKEKLAKGLTRVKTKLDIRQIPPEVWQLDFLLCSQGKALESFWNWVGKYVDGSYSSLQMIVQNVLEFLPNFFCAHMDVKSALIPNYSILYRWFLTLYEDDRCTSMVCVVDAHGRQIPKYVHSMVCIHSVFLGVTVR